MLYSAMLTSSDLTMLSMTHDVDTEAALTALNLTINQQQLPIRGKAAENGGL